jgi:site-specific DNA-methyltransferase (adenine-specific)
MDAVEFLCSLPDDSVDMGITSPPYDNLRTYDGHSDFDFETIAHEAYRVLKPGGVLVWIVGDATVNGSETLTSMRQALYFVDVVGFKMHDTMIYQMAGTGAKGSRKSYWQEFEYMFVLVKHDIKTTNMQGVKVNYKRSGQRRYKNGNHKTGKTKVITNTIYSNVWRLSVGGGHTTKDKEAYAHPAMFPEKLAERHILTWSNPGDVVMDFFMGSGTTAKMARKNGRDYIGCDVNQDYVDLARARLDKPYTPNMFIDEPASDERPEQTKIEW